VVGAGAVGATGDLGRLEQVGPEHGTPLPRGSPAVDSACSEIEAAMSDEEVRATNPARSEEGRA